MVLLAEWVPSSSVVYAMCMSECEIHLSHDQVAFHACFDSNVNITVGTKSEVWILPGLEDSPKGKDTEQQDLRERQDPVSKEVKDNICNAKFANIFRNLLKFTKITGCTCVVILCLGLRPVMQNNFWQQNYIA